MNEFALIRAIVAELGEAGEAPWAQVGPGDDAAVLAARPGRELVASIDALVEGVHFPMDAPAELVGYRALMVTDTALYRYPYYHSAQDTPDKILYPELARVTEGLFGALSLLAAEGFDGDAAP